jgi:hypothetical protein
VVAGGGCGDDRSRRHVVSGVCRGVLAGSGSAVGGGGGQVQLPTSTYRINTYTPQAMKRKGVIH